MVGKQDNGQTTLNPRRYPGNSTEPTCFYCDFCCDGDVWSLNLSETELSSSCHGFGIVACPYFCCEAV